jgi:hypothetical protein
MTTTKDRSTYSESLIFPSCFYWNIYLRDDSSFHNVYKDGYHNTDSPCDQLDCDVGTYHSNAQLEQVKSNILEGIQHFETVLVWNNWENER